MTSSSGDPHAQVRIFDLHMERSRRVNRAYPVTMLWMDKEGVGHYIRECLDAKYKAVLLLSLKKR